MSQSALPSPLDTFKQSAPSTGQFGATRQEIEAGLADRLADPWKIKQGPSSLCGAAAIMYAEAKYRPDQYAQYVIDLYLKGHAKLGKKPVAATGKFATSSGSSARAAAMDAVDWMALASLRHSKTSSYDDVNDDVSAMTLPNTMQMWLRQIGYTDINNKTSFTKMFSSGMPSSKSLKAAVDELAAGKVVFLFVNHKLFKPYFPDPSGQYPHQHQPYTNRSLHADHWGVLLGGQVLESGDAQIKVYCWGDEQQVPTAGMLSKHDINLHYFGFVAAAP